MRIQQPATDTDWIFDPTIGRQQYVQRLIKLYCSNPTTCGRARPEDYHLAKSLFSRRIPAAVVEASLVLAAARRTFRDPRRSPLAPVRSLHYFLPVIEEILSTPIDPDYIGHLESNLQNAEKILERYRALESRIADH